MNSFSRIKTKRFIIIVLLLSVLFLQFSFFIVNISSARPEHVPGFHKKDRIQSNEQVNYYFSNNLIFKISTDVIIDIEIRYDNIMQNREIFFVINNSSPISLNVTSRPDMRNFGYSQAPMEPVFGDFQFRYRFNCIYRIGSNVTINNLTLTSIKSAQYGFDLNKDYSFALYNSTQDSWMPIDTIETVNESSSEVSLTSSIQNLDASTEVYITFLEINPIFSDWLWILFLGIGILAVVVVVLAISKRDYFQYLRTRTVPIEKGAHRLTLEEVLENENRNKIIDLVLNEPGIHFNELLRKTELAAGNLVWHLDILETYKIIGKKRLGKFIAYFPYYQKNPISNLDLKLSKSKVTLEILEIIEEEPGIWNSAIKRKLNVDHKTIQYHVNKLKELDLIYFKTEGRKNKIYPNLEAEYFNKKNNGSS